jgi:hypothetical protein
VRHPNAGFELQTWARTKKSVALLAGGPASVDQDCVAGDQRGGGGCQEDYGAGDFDGFTDAVKGSDAFDCVGAKGGIGERFFGARCLDESWRDGVHGNVEFAPLDGETFCQMRDGSFAGAVDGFGGKRDESSLRTHVDDATAVLADHDFRGGLRGEECRFQIYIQRGVELFFGDVDGEIGETVAGVVDEDVEFAEAFSGGVDRGGDLVEFGDVHLNREGVTTEGFDFGDKILGGVFVAKAQCDIGARGGERDCDCAAESAGGSGNESSFAGEREVRNLRVGGGHGR